MKKFFPLIIVSAFSLSLFAQDNAGDMKNFRFGVTALPSLSWYKPDNPKRFSKDGSVFRFGVLLNGEYNLSGNFAMGFGIGIGSGGGKIDFTGTSKQDTVDYYYNTDKGILLLGDTAGLNKKWEQYRLIGRTYNASYYILPISLKMRTNEIGYIRYFFEPRFNICLRKKVFANDNEVSMKTNQSSSQTKIDITKDMAFFRMSVTLSAGGEYYLSGSTAFVFAIGYDYGLSNVVKGTSDYLFRDTRTSGVVNLTSLEQKFTQGGIVLSAGILF
ncbi:MAG: outer membrane beta-barrel protein [Bacteroidetes bacterium]|nr:outer membrane beta-barrel protein [Bacteroidota bacterium]